MTDKTAHASAVRVDECEVRGGGCEFALDSYRPIRDWESIKTAYCEGLRSNVALAREYGMAESAIRKRAKRDGWVRQASAEKVVKARRDELVRDKIVADSLTKEEYAQYAAAVVDPEKSLEVAAMVTAEVVRGHQKQIAKLMGLVAGMLLELEAAAIKPEELALIAEMKAMCLGQMEEGVLDAAGVQRHIDAHAKLLGLGSRTKIAKDLADVMKTLIGVERQAFSISDNANGDADTKEVVEVTDNEVARRVAFILSKAAGVTN